MLHRKVKTAQPTSQPKYVAVELWACVRGFILTRTHVSSMFLGRKATRLFHFGPGFGRARLILRVRRCFPADGPGLTSRGHLRAPGTTPGLGLLKLPISGVSLLGGYPFFCFGAFCQGLLGL